MGEKMEIHRFKPYLNLILVAGVTVLLLAFTVDVKLVDVPGINRTLPTKVGVWRGKELRICQKLSCETTYTVDDLPKDMKCTKCGTELGTKAAAEAAGLPVDTEILKSRFEDGTGRVITAGYVLSGKERVSIHRPEVCMRGGGNTIVGHKYIDVVIPGRKATLPVKILLMQQEYRNPTDGAGRTYHSYYAYWFVGNGVETAQHLVRMFRMSFDRVLFSRSHRWAYIQVYGERDPENEDAWLPSLTEFIGGFYPQIVEGVENRVK